jgi:hypothetical protein
MRNIFSRRVACDSHRMSEKGGVHSCIRQLCLVAIEISGAHFDPFWLGLSARNALDCGIATCGATFLSDPSHTLFSWKLWLGFGATLGSDLGRAAVGEIRAQARLTRAFERLRAVRRTGGWAP